MTNEELWKTVLGEMELSLTRANFTTWFKNTSVLSKDKNAVVISVPNGFIKEWLENKFNKKILESIRGQAPEIREVRYTIGRPKAELVRHDFSNIVLERELESRSVPEVDKDIDQTTNLNKKYTFESFVVGSNNELAHAASLAVTKNLGKLYNPLFLYGGVGLGKTHLLQSIGNRVSNENSSKNILYISAEKFTSSITETIMNRTIEELKSKYSQLDLLIIDDIQFIAGKEKTQEIVFSTFNELYGKNKQIVLSSDRPPQAIPTLEERLRSRFEGGMIADIGVPDFETRLAILKQKSHEKNYDFENETLVYVATHIQKNVRELEGALNRIVAYHQLSNSAPTKESAKSLLITTSAKPSRGGVTCKRLMEMVSEFFDISLKDLAGASRKKELVIPRQITMYLLREELSFSYPHIGQQLGGRDHTTAMHACTKIEEYLSKNEKIRNDVALLRQKIYE